MNLPPSASAGIPGLPITLPPVEGIQNEGGIAVSNARFICGIRLMARGDCRPLALPQ
jgi:hypothetical protein